MSAAPDRPTVAIQGEPASNSALAAAQFFAADVGLAPCTTFAELFAAVADGRAHYGMAPVENSLAGSIHQTWHLLVEKPLPVIGEIYFHVDHCLVAHPGVRLKELHRVYSHEQALAQCQNFLRHSLEHAEQKEAYDTAGAVQMIKRENWKDAAAIAPERAALNHGMQVLARNIQTNPDNYTRFLILAGQTRAFSEQPLKTTLVLRMHDTARHLPAVLARLEELHIETHKIETRKHLGHPWEYLVYVELAGNATEADIAAAIKEMRPRAQSLHLVGTYPAAARP